MKNRPLPTKGVAKSFMLAASTSAMLAWPLASSFSLIDFMKSWICLSSSSSLNDLIFDSKEFWKSFLIFFASSLNTSGSITLVDGASDARRLLNCSRSWSRCLKISTLTKASRRCTALPLLSRNAWTKFVMVFSNVEVEISMPRGAEALGKSSARKKLLVNSSRSCRKSLSMSEKSPLNWGLSTFRPGCGRPKQETELKICLSLSTVSLRPSGALCSSRRSRRCSLIISLHLATSKPSLYQLQSRTRNSRWPKGAPSLDRPEHAACAKVVK
mmetsp:Transcript_20038/g.51238  ORF Transcript_20038/g.51238 Transcript_20038/m.51238 type:complete len:271 (+) Transcript_20038:283-1095(+)